MLQFCYVFLTVLIMCLTLNNLSASKFNVKEKLQILIITDITVYFASCISQSLILLIATICLSILLYLKTKKFTISIGLPILSTLICAMSDMIVSYIESSVFNIISINNKNILDYFIIYSSCFIFTFIISKMLGMLINKNVHIRLEDIKGKSGLLIILSLVLTFSIILANIIIGQQNGITDKSVRINLILFTMYFVLLMIIMFVLVSNIKKEMKFESTKKEYENLKEYTSNLEGLYNDMRVFRHDYINILSSMAGYFENKDIEGLEKHFNENIIPLGEGMKSNNFKIGLLQNIKIPEIKGIISSKVIRAQEAGIDVSLEVMEPIEKISMNIIDLSRVVGILIDNAIEACEKCENPHIKLGIIKKDNSIVMVLINSAPENTPPIYKIYKRGFSTKGDNRGLGLSNLKEIVNRYKTVTLDTIIENGSFIQSIEIKN